MKSLRSGRILRRTSLAAWGLTAALVLGVSVVVVAPAGTAAAVGGATRFAAVSPCRILDTRGGSTPAPGATLSVPVAGTCEVPPESRAVAVTVTSVGAVRDGFVTVWPADLSMPEVSNLNVAGGETRANSAVVRLGAGGLNLHLDAGGHVLVDVTGAFVPADTSHDGRFTPIPPARVVDTRGSGRPAPMSSVLVTRPAGVPADAVALAVNITTSETLGAGYFTAYPAGGPIPNASVLNTDGPGQTRAAAAIVPVSSTGFGVLTSAGDHVIVDVTGWFTGPSAPKSSDGLFVPADPVRSLDTRHGGGAVWANSHAVFLHPSGARFGQLVGNVTMVVGGGSPGFATLCAPNASLDCGDLTSSVNADAGAVANSFVGLAVDQIGEAWLRTSAEAHLLVDVSGGFLGTPPAHRPDWMPHVGSDFDDPFAPPPDPFGDAGLLEHPAGPTDAWARQWAERCLPASVLARLDTIDTRWKRVRDLWGGDASIVEYSFGSVVVAAFFWINLGDGNAESVEWMCSQLVPHETMHVLDYSSGDPSSLLSEYLGPLTELQHSECLAQAIELIMLETDRYLYYDDDPVIRTCTRSVQARDLALVLWDRADGAYWRWSGSIVVRR